MKTWFNAEAYHGIAAGVYYADQLVLKDVLGNDYSILTSNHPLPPNSTEAIQKNVNFFIQGKKDIYPKSKLTLVFKEVSFRSI